MTTGPASSRRPDASARSTSDDPVDAAIDAPTPPRPDVWEPAGAAVEAVFAGLAKLQRARALHPRGATFTATITSSGDEAELPFARDGGRDAVVRLSKSIGLPPKVPDFFGLSLRVPDAYGPGEHQDLMLATTGSAPVARHVLVPTVGFDRRIYTSLLPYRDAGGQLVTLAARYAGRPRSSPLHIDELDDALAAGDLRFDLCVAAPREQWRVAAHLELHARVAPEDSARLRFHPWNSSEQLRPAGFFNRIRSRAYEGSQRSDTSA